MSNHTPGPWAIGNHPGGKWGSSWRDIVANDERGQLYITHGLLGGNAELIAAAPLLLEALEEARDALFSGAPVTVGLENLITNALRLAKTGRMFDQ